MTIDYDISTDVISPEDTVLRERALKRLQKKRGLQAHFIVYTLVNSFTVAVWLMTGADGFFWPVFLIAFWGVGLVMNTWDVYRTDEFSDEDIAREVARLR